MKEAFYYMFKDNKIAQKFLSIYAVALLPFVLVPIGMLIPSHIFTIILIITTILSICILPGYWIRCTNAVVTQEKNIVLPFLNFDTLITDFITGIHFIFANTLYSLAFGLLILIISCIKPLAIIIIAIIILFLMFIKEALTYIYVNSRKLNSYFKIGKALNFISKNKLQYILAIFLIFIMNLPYGVVGNLLEKDPPISSGSIYVVLTLLFIPYNMFVTAYLNGKCLKKECLEELK